MEDRVVITAALIEKINALPIGNSIVLTEKGIQINGRDLETEQVINFKESCIALNDNYARKIINQQLKFMAIIEGVHKGLSPEQLSFSKAALWLIEQEQALIEKIVIQGTGFQA